MALYQVVEQNGQKSLIDVASGDSGSGGGGMPNTEVWITESGTWTAPVTGWYEALLIGGGNGGFVDAAGNAAIGGASGEYREGFVHLTEGQQVAVVIGVGGTGVINATNSSLADSTAGGITSFGDMQTRTFPNTIHNVATQDFDLRRLPPFWRHGLPTGGGWMTGNGFGADASRSFFYGAGGGVSFPNTTGSGATAQNGIAGAVRLRYYDPNKA